jgi:hypothetical protein
LWIDQLPIATGVIQASCNIAHLVANVEAGLGRC